MLKCSLQRREVENWLVFEKKFTSEICFSAVEMTEALFYRK